MVTAIMIRQLHRFLTRLSCFFFNGTAPTEIYTLSLHDALPIWYGGNAKGQTRRYEIHARANEAITATRRRKGSLAKIGRAHV